MTVSAAGSSMWSSLAHMPSVLDHRIVIVRGRGSTVWTAAGDQLLDATAGLWHANIGHGRAEVAEAAHRQMLRLETYHAFGFFSNDVALTLADRLAVLSPVPDAKVLFTSGGSDGVDAAAKLARRHWQLAGLPEKTVILSRADSYHGLHAFGSSLSGPDMYRDGYGEGTLVPDTGRFSSTDAEDLSRVAADLGVCRIAAIILEPVIGSGGVIAPPPGYLERVQEQADRLNALLIVDEVVTGFGRTGRWFASERWSLRPDLLITAKGITSGYAPLGAVLVAERVWAPYFSGDHAPVFQHGLTYSGHATAAAIAHANLDILEREELIDRAARLEGVLIDALAPLGSHPAVREIRTGGGLLAGVVLEPDVDAAALVRRTLERGVIVRALRNGVLQISPPFVITDDEVGIIASTLRKALDHVGQ